MSEFLKNKWEDNYQKYSHLYTEGFQEEKPPLIQGGNRIWEWQEGRS